MNGLHLLIQIIFALRPFHLRFHAGLDLFLDLEDGHFALHQAIDLFKPLAHAQGFQQVLFLFDFDAQMPGDKVGQLGRFRRFRDGGQGFFGDVLFDLGVAFEFGPDRTQKRLCRGVVARHFVHEFGGCFEIVRIFEIIDDPHPRLTFDQHLYGAVGQFQQLQDIRQHARLVNAIRFRIVLARIDLAGQQDLAIVGHHLFQGADRFFTPYEQGDNHVGENHDIPQRQHRIGRVQGMGHAQSLVLAKGSGPE